MITRPSKADMPAEPNEVFLHQSQGPEEAATLSFWNMGCASRMSRRFHGSVTLSTAGVVAPPRTHSTPSIHPSVSRIAKSRILTSSNLYCRSRPRKLPIVSQKRRCRFCSPVPWLSLSIFCPKMPSSAVAMQIPLPTHNSFRLELVEVASTLAEDSNNQRTDVQVCLLWAGLRPPDSRILFNTLTRTSGLLPANRGDHPAIGWPTADQGATSTW